jgi:hypothetical protein
MSELTRERLCGTYVRIWLRYALTVYPRDPVNELDLRRSTRINESGTAEGYGLSSLVLGDGRSFWFPEIENADAVNG